MFMWLYAVCLTYWSLVVVEFLCLYWGSVTVRYRMLRCNPGDFLAVLNIRWNYSPIFLRVLGKNTWIMQQHSVAVVGLNEIFLEDCAYWVILDERRVGEGMSEGEQEREVSGMCSLVLLIIQVMAGAKCNYGVTQAENWDWSMGCLV